MSQNKAKHFGQVWRVRTAGTINRRPFTGDTPPPLHPALLGRESSLPLLLKWLMCADWKPRLRRGDRFPRLLPARVCDPPPPRQEDAQALPSPPQRHLSLWWVRRHNLMKTRHWHSYNYHDTDTTARMSCTWAALLRTLLLSSGCLTLGPTLTGTEESLDPFLLKWNLDIGAYIDRYRMLNL